MSGKTFPALRVIASCIRILAGLIAAGAIATAVAPPPGTGGPMATLVTVALVAGGVLSALVLWAGAELIDVALAIEQNTRPK